MKTGRLSEQEKEVVKTMREEGNGYNEIARVLNCKKDRVRAWGKSKGLGGFNKKANSNPENALTVFIDNLRKKTNGTMEYISGYKDCDSKVLLRCLKCGEEITKSAQFARKEKKLICNGCIAIARKHREEAEQREREQQRAKAQQEKKEAEARAMEAKRKAMLTECQECGEIFQAERFGKKYCSYKCQQRKASRDKETKRRHNLRDSDDTDYSITLPKLIKRDKNKCHICGGVCDREDYKQQGKVFIAGNNYPSIDHVYPISKGGAHTWDNIKLAHRSCNSVKSNSDIYRNEDGQLSMAL